MGEGVRRDTGIATIIMPTVCRAQCSVRYVPAALSVCSARHHEDPAVRMALDHVAGFHASTPHVLPYTRTTDPVPSAAAMYVAIIHIQGYIRKVHLGGAPKALYGTPTVLSGAGEAYRRRRVETMV